MRNPHFRRVALLVALLGGNLAVAGMDTPHRFAPWSLDRNLSIVENPVDGRTFAVWSYRARGQYDLAISVRAAGSSLWGEPIFVGATDGLQQVQPSIAVDPSGNTYVAFVVRETGEIQLTVLRSGAEVWSAPVTVTPNPGRRFMPLARVVGDRLVIAFHTLSGLDLVDLALLTELVGGHGVEDGPDTIPGHDGEPPPGDEAEDDGSLGRTP